MKLPVVCARRIVDNAHALPTNIAAPTTSKKFKFHKRKKITQPFYSHELFARATRPEAGTSDFML